MSPESKILILKERSLLLQKVRSFFFSRGVLEVDTPILSRSAPIDEHIDIMEVDLGQDLGYLHSSPEYAMKRLLALGIGDIFQLSHVFRKGEVGRLHNPEFTLIEWYRTQFSFEEIIQETLCLIHLFLGDLPYSTLTYRQSLITYAGIDYLYASEQDLQKAVQKHGIELSSDWDFESLLHLLMGSIVEPHLGQNELLVLIDYPASQAALAQTEQKGEEKVAKRFEIYFKGVELANGYLELTEAQEQRKRLTEASLKREALGKKKLPVDERFLDCLEKGLPRCCGVAVGFDRLFMLKEKQDSLKPILSLSWDEV